MIKKSLTQLLQYLTLSTKKGYYICFEGSEGVGKTTQVSKIVNYLKDQGFSVFETKEPGTSHSPLTLVLRELVLNSKFDLEENATELIDKLSLIMSQHKSELSADAKEMLLQAREEVEYEKVMTTWARELITQAIRNVHLINVVAPALLTHDYVIQDRGILSGLAYGKASGNEVWDMITLNQVSVKNSKIASTWKDCYSQIIILKGNVAKGLSRAQSAKQEFIEGDVMEKRGVSFLDQVNSNFDDFALEMNRVDKVMVDNKSIEEVFEEIKKVLK